MTHSSIAERFVLDQIPLRHRRLIAPKLKLAYETVDGHIAGTPFLQVPTARDNRGRLLSWAVDFALKGLIESGEWPVDYRWQVFAKPTGRYLEIILPHSTLTVSQVAFWNEQPRDVQFRSNARMGNLQIRLPGFEEEEPEEESAGPISLLLVHGYKELEFAHIGVPHAHHGNGYIYQTPNLQRLLYEAAPPDVPPPESAVDVDELMSLKEEIERWQKDSGL